MLHKTRSLDKCIIIFSGFNQRAVIAFVRTLTKHNLAYAIIAKSFDDSMLLSEYRNKILAIRKTSQLVLEDILRTIKEVQNKQPAEKYIITPSSEALNRFVLNNRDIFKKYRCQIPLVDKHTYELISDKYSFGKLCSINDIIIPKEIGFSQHMQLPVVAKPKGYFSRITGESLSPQVLTNSQSIDTFFHKNDINEFYFQEYIQGRCFYLLYCFTNNGVTYRFSQENIVQQSNGRSMLYAVSSNFHYSEESFKYIMLFKKLKFRGLVMVEVKQRHSENYMIEANPRLWGPSQLFVDAGVNLFEAWLYDNGVIKNLPSFIKNNKTTKYFWFGGVLEEYRRQRQLTFYVGNETDFIDSLPLCMQYDVYRRPDTLGIFKKELFNGSN